MANYKVLPQHTNFLVSISFVPASKEANNKKNPKEQNQNSFICMMMMLLLSTVSVIITQAQGEQGKTSALRFTQFTQNNFPIYT
jgi:uncharacterized membrane protein